MGGIDRATVANELRQVLRDTLQLKDHVPLAPDTLLLGNIPELDSMAVVAVMTALEERFGFVIEDDEISAETFTSVATLLEFVASKAGA